MFLTAVQYWPTASHEVMLVIKGLSLTRTTFSYIHLLLSIFLKNKFGHEQYYLTLLLF